MFYNSSMKETTAISRLEEGASSQWGMFTTAQAEQHGVSRQHIAQLLKRGQIERASSGVYRFTSAPITSSDDIKAAWLSTNPKKFAHERIAHKNYDVVITGPTAAYLYEVGDLYASPYTFGVQMRRQSQRPDIRYVKSSWDDEDIILIEGLPTARPEKTIADLIRSHEDTSLVSDVAIDFERTGHALSIEKLDDQLSVIRGNHLTAEDIFREYEGFPLMQLRESEKKAQRATTDWRLVQQALSQSADMQRLINQWTFDIEKLPDLSQLTNLQALLAETIHTHPNLLALTKIGQDISKTYPGLTALANMELPSMPYLQDLRASLDKVAESYQEALHSNEAVRQSLAQSTKALKDFTERRDHE